MATKYMRRVLNTPAQDMLGTNTSLFRISASLSLSVGDTYVVGKLPNRAIPVGAVFYPQGTIEAKFGTGPSLSMFFASATFVAAAYFNTKGLGTAVRISLSDDAVLRHENVTMVTSAGLSLGYIGDLVVTYVMQPELGAMATLYMGQSATNQPRSNRGANIGVYRISASVTVSVGDTWVIGKLPHGAIPVGAVFYPAVQVNAKFGTSASLELFFVSDTYSVAAGAQGGAIQSNLRLGTAQQISVTAADTVPFENVTMVAGTTDASLGYMGDLVVTYVMPT